MVLHLASISLCKFCNDDHFFRTSQNIKLIVTGYEVFFFYAGGQIDYLKIMGCGSCYKLIIFDHILAGLF